MSIWLVLSLIAALFEAFAVQRNIPKLEFFAKPAVMICLLIWLYAATGLRESAFWFGLGLLLSLVGDIVLMNSSDSMFLLGTLAFLLTHIFYLVGLKGELLALRASSLVLFALIYLSAVLLLRRIVGGMRATQQSSLAPAVIGYGLVISLMLYAAMSTIFDPQWKRSAAFFVGAGAFLFWISDLLLAWNKFVSPIKIKNGSLLTMLAYHLGQIGLIAGVISQFMSLS